MPLLKTEADKLSNNDLVAGVVEEIIDRDDLFAVLPFVKTNGKAYVYNRESTVSEGNFLDPNDTIIEEASTFTEVTTNLRVLVGDVDVDNFLSETESDTNSQYAIQIAQKAKGIGRKFRRTLVQGNRGVDAKEFDGLEVLLQANATQRILAGANGGALTLSMIDDLIDKVDNGADAIMMRRGTFRALKALWRAAGGNTGGMLQIENYGMVPAHDGVPIILNDFIDDTVAQGTAPNTASVYALRLNESDGLHGLFGGESLGIRVENIGTVQNKDAVRTRLKWYCGLALKSTKSLASVYGVTNI